jgi:xylan 1,4-beta-xylosidase
VTSALRNALWILLPLIAVGQQPATVSVDAGQKTGTFTPAWAYFGYDEPNYTYAPHGQKLIKELAGLSRAPVHMRTHFLLATDDGKPGLKWGATNAYTEDASGNPKYDWTEVDKILGTYVGAGAIPFVEIGFMPKALSTRPDPYNVTWAPGAKNEGYFAGWTYPPNDYGKWSELIYRWVTHCVEKYGKSEVERWDWEVWNEPDIGYWHGTPDEYDKLYDYTAAAVKRALPTARVGGPASTGPSGQKASAFLRQFLEHCANGKNYATGRQGSPLDFISFHAKGRPRVIGDHVQMGLVQEMSDAERGFEIVRSFPAFQDLPIVLSEADPEGCAACSARVYPQNAYRNGSLYAAYEAAALKRLVELSVTHRVNLQGILTWAFEFEDQPPFDGLRTLATIGIDKPVLNFFRMAGLLGNDLVKAKGAGGVDCIATRTDHRVGVLVWNFREEDVPAANTDVRLEVSGIPGDASRVLVRHYRIDDDHSNAYTAWKQMGSPQTPTQEQYKKLEAAGQLQMLGSPTWVNAKNGSASLDFALPVQGLSLLDVSW